MVRRKTHASPLPNGIGARGEAEERSADLEREQGTNGSRLADVKSAMKTLPFLRPKMASGRNTTIYDSDCCRLNSPVIKRLNNTTGSLLRYR